MRDFSTKPKVIILDEPTRDIDIWSKAAVHAFMAELAAHGVGHTGQLGDPEVLGMWHSCATASLGPW